MARRPTTATVIEVRAECQRCMWRADKPNAQALAAQHYDKKGHQVRVTSTTQITYGSAAGKGRGKADSQESML